MKRSALFTVIGLCLGAASAAPVAAAPLETVTVVGTTDLHGRLGQLPRFAGYLRILRQAPGAHVILVDSGDVLQGTLESDSNEGQAVVAAYRLLKYDAVAIGNHEFDFGPVGPHATPQSADEDGQGALKAAVAAANPVFPFLAANLRQRRRDSHSPSPLDWNNVRPSTLVRIPLADLTVGIIGVTTAQTPETTNALNFAGLSVVPLSQEVLSQARAVRQKGAQIVVVAAHAGGGCQRLLDAHDLSSCDAKSEIFALAEALPRGTVDVIMAGHAHAGIAHEVNGIAIAEAYSYGQAFSRIDVTYDRAKQQVSSLRIFQPQALADASYENQPVKEDTQVRALVEPYLAAAEKKKARVLGGTVDATFARSYEVESALGDWVTSEMLQIEPRAEVALTNGGGLRADLAPGPLTYGHLYTVLPFENRMVLLTLSGRALRQIFESNAVSRGGILSVAGLKVNAQCEAGKLRVELRRARDLPEQVRPSSQASTEGPGTPPSLVADDDTVRVVTTDFLARGGDGFGGSGYVAPTPLDLGPVLREAIALNVQKEAPTLHLSDWATKYRFTVDGKRPLSCGPPR